MDSELGKSRKSRNGEKKKTQNSKVPQESSSTQSLPSANNSKNVEESLTSRLRGSEGLEIQSDEGEMELGESIEGTLGPHKKRRKTKTKGERKKPLPSAVGQKEALEYLRCWHEERSSWCFKKKTQFWLLKNMYYKEKLPKPDFRVMLRYLEGLHGNQRQVAVKTARGIVEEYNNSSGVDGASVSKSKYHRGRKVLRTLI